MQPVVFDLPVQEKGRVVNRQEIVRAMDVVMLTRLQFAAATISSNFVEIRQYLS